MSRSALFEEEGIAPQRDALLALRFVASRLAQPRHRKAHAARSGARLSRFRGRGMDYRESRQYASGDDIRSMDWRVMARSGTPHTKLFEEERERPVVVVIDTGPAMAFGSGKTLKQVTAAHIAALLGWATVGRGDRIGAVNFGRTEHHELKPTGGRRGALALAHALVDWCSPLPAVRVEQPGESPEEYPGESLANALRRLRRVARPGTSVILLADLAATVDHAAASAHQDAGELGRELFRLRAHHDLRAIHVQDPFESQPLPTGSFPVRTSQGSLRLDTQRRRRRRQLEAYFQQRRDRALAFMERHGVPVQCFTSGDELATVVGP